jgi:hypothetical protein
LHRLSSSLELQVGQKREWCSEESEHAAGIGAGIDSTGAVETSGVSVVCIRR